MVRRRSPPPAGLGIPDGWAAHDGSGCPVDGDIRPAVMFRSGLRIQPGKRRAEEWQSYAGYDCWNWGEEYQGTDIVAFRVPESNL